MKIDLNRADIFLFDVFGSSSALNHEFIQGHMMQDIIANNATYSCVQKVNMIQFKKAEILALSLYRIDLIGLVSG